VTVLERVNARHLTREQVPDPVDLIVCDASFIGLETVLPAPLSLAAPEAALVTLIKPQFEVGRERVGKGGIVRDEAARDAALDDVGRAAEALGFTVRGHLPSPIAGREGNREWLLWLSVAVERN